MDGARRYLEDTLDLIGEASSDPALWRDVAMRLMTHTRAAAGAIYVESRTVHPGGALPTEFAHLVNYGERWVERYFEHYAALNPYLLRPELQVSGRLMTERNLQGPLKASEREFVTDWQHAQGFRHVIAEFLQDRAEGILTLVFWRDAGAGAASEAERGEFDQLARAANRAVRVGDRLRQAGLEAFAANAVLDHLDTGIVTLDRAGRVRSASRLAEALLAARDGIALRRGRLEALYPQDQGALQRLLADIRDPRHALAAERREIRLRRSGGRPMLRVSAVAVHQRLPGFRADEGTSAVIVVRAPEPAMPRAETLIALWGLTAAEARLALLLAQPLSLSEAARHLGIGRETARSHLKALFAKTGSHGQTELVVRILSGKA